MGDTYQENRVDSLLGNVWGGMKTGFLGGSLFGGVGAIPGAIAGGIAGVGKSIWDKVDEGNDRERWREENGVNMDELTEYAQSQGGTASDAYEASEEVFYEQREAERAEERENQGVLGDIWDWVWE